MTEKQRRTSVNVGVKQRVQPPREYDVIMYNDDETTMNFVVEVLIEVYEYSMEDAVTKMLEIDASTSQVVGCYPKCIAEHKLQMTERMKREQGYLNFRVEMRVHG